MSGRRNFLAGSLALLTTGCGNIRFPVTESGLEAQSKRGINVIPVTTENILAVREPTNTWISQHGAGNPPPNVQYTYRVGSGDVLQIRFFADPTGIADAADFAPQTTIVVDEEGQFFYPFVGTMQASGRTVNEIRVDLVERLGEFFTMPQVEVSVAAFNAHQVTIVGAVASPGRRTLTNVPTTLLDLVNEAGQGPDVDLQRILLRRDGRQYTVNLMSFLETGNKRNNPILLPDDLVRVPEDANNQIYTFGEIETDVIPISDTRKTLTEVLAESGGIDRLRADARGVFVFRRNEQLQKGFDVYQFDLSDAAALVLGADFGMAPLDIVFVTNNPPTRWADTISTLLLPFNSILSARITANNLSD